MKRKILFLLFPAFLLAKFQVTTFFPMETYLVKYIGKNEIRIKQINNRFIEEKKYISTDDIKKLSDVRIYFNLGLSIEKEYEKIFKDLNPYIKNVDLSKKVSLIQNNPYFWLDPFNLRIVSKNITDEFCKIDRLNCKFYKANYQEFLELIDDTFLKIKEKIYSSDMQNIYVLDDYWLYFARRFRLNFIKREKKYLKLGEINDFIDYNKKRYITKIVNLKGSSINIAESISKNGNLQLIENNPFEENILLNIQNLSEEILKKK